MERTEMTDKSCKEFIEALASRAPVPGGGGASALMGAVGTALGDMVGSLTLGKKKYADVQEEVIRLKEEAARLEREFLELVQADADAFEPLSRAYGLPRETEEQRQYKEEVMEEALAQAGLVPVKIMECCCRAIDLVEKMEQIGSVIAISDAGCAAAGLRGALTGASLNVFINTKSMRNREYARELEQRTEEMLEQYIPRCDEIFRKVLDRVHS